MICLGVEFYEFHLSVYQHETMVFCPTCGKQAPCGIAHRKGKPTQRSRNFANARTGKQPVQNVRPIPQKREGWSLHGPNVPVKRFPGMVTTSLDVAVRSKTDGRWYAFRVRDVFQGIGDSVSAYGIAIRLCLDHADGTFGLIEGWKPDQPTAPSPLSRRKFKAGVSTGIQLLAPTGCKISDIPEDLWFVVRYDKEFTVDDIVWFRSYYVQHSIPTVANIPDDILYTESSDAMDKICSTSA